MLEAVKCLKTGIIIGNYVILSTRCSAARVSRYPSSSLSSHSSFIYEKNQLLQGQRYSVAQCIDLIVKCFNSQAIDFELSIILECMVYEFHPFPTMKLIDLRARQIERPERVWHEPALTTYRARLVERPDS